MIVNITSSDTNKKKKKKIRKNEKTANNNSNSINNEEEDGKKLMSDNSYYSGILKDKEKVNFQITGINALKNKLLNEDDIVKLEDDGDDEKDNFKYKEGGWGWIVLIACGYCFGSIVSLINDYTLIYDAFDVEYKNKTENHLLYASAIGSLATGLQFLFCPIGSFMADIYGPRNSGILGGVLSTLGLFLSSLIENIKLHLLTYGVIFGIGQAFMLASTLAILPHYFNKRLGLANGLMNFIAAIIVVLNPIATDYFIEKFKLSKTFLFLSLVNFICVLMSITFTPHLPLASGHSFLKKLKDSFGLEVFKRKEFNIWCLASLIGMFGYLLPLVVITHFSKINFPGPENKHEILPIIFGLASAFGALIFGKLGDITKFNRVHYHTGLYVVYGLALIGIPFSTSFRILQVLYAILGFMDGVLLSFIVPISCDLSGSSKLSNQAAGYYHAILAPTTIIGPPVASYLYSEYNSYDIAFFTSGVACIVCALILIIFIFPFDLTFCLESKKKSYDIKKRTEN